MMAGTEAGVLKKTSRSQGIRRQYLVLLVAAANGMAAWAMVAILLNRPFKARPATVPGVYCGLSISSAYISDISVTDAAPIAWTVSNFVSNGTVTLNHSTSTRALNVSGLVNNGFYTLLVLQDSTGGAVMTGGTGCIWLIPGGTGSGQFPVSTAASGKSTVSFTYDGTYCWVAPGGG